MHSTLRECFLSAPTLSGCLNGLPSYEWPTAFAPGTVSPSISVVRKILLSQTTGDECPRPTIGVFHLIFFVSLHSVGRLVSAEMPLPSGPRHCDQLLFGTAPVPEANDEFRTNTHKLNNCVRKTKRLIN